MSRSPRRKGREAALQLLYQVELTGDLSEATLELFWEQHPSEAAREEGASTRDFAESLVRGVMADRARIDALIDDAARNWDLERISRVDLSVLRLAVGEMLAMPETPTAVIINEAVEIARRFSDEKAASFINAVVDRVAREQRSTDQVPRRAAEERPDAVDETRKTQRN
ncbi:MAG: transcription antitermination factor NusB [Deltaproteobacteria bacterium]|nr:transcription antitermination factor NusB [Deltaproteobacteria bacterium]